MKKMSHPARIRCFSVSFLVGIIFLSACSYTLPTPTPQQPTITPTATITSSPTITVVWFPATNTPTKMQSMDTPVPTNISGPSDRISIMTDDFTDESSWELFREENSSSALGDGELTLAVSKPGIMINTFRTGSFPDDYYLEISTNPSLCRDADSYGLLLRVTNPYTYYRAGINCNGQVRFEWVRDGKGIPLLDWTPSKTGLIGSTTKDVIGIWAVDREIRVYINGVYQYSVYGLTQTEGGFGLFTRSAGETSVTVNFSDLQVFQPGTLPPTATSAPTSIPSPTPTIRVP